MIARRTSPIRTLFLAATALAFAASAALAASQEAGRTLNVEAEYANGLTYPFEIVEEPGAGGGLALMIPEGAGSMEGLGGAPGVATYRIRVPESGTWSVWLRVKWNGVCSNSLFVALGDDNQRMLTSKVLQQWHWVPAGRWQLPTATGELRLINREDGVWVDRILLSPHGFTPSDDTPATECIPHYRAETSWPVCLLLGAATDSQRGLGPTDFVLHHSPLNAVPLDAVRTFVVQPGRPAQINGWLRNNALKATSVRLRLETEAPVTVEPAADQTIALADREPLHKAEFRVCADAATPRRSWPLTIRVEYADGRAEVQSALLERPFDWRVSGALACPADLGIETPDPFDVRAPADAGGRVRWRPLPPEAVTPFGLLDMRVAVADTTYAMAYAWTRVVTEEDGEFLLDVRHDDMIRVWINGEDVFTNTDKLPSVLTRKLVRVKLRKGENDLLVKICQERNYWEFGVHFLTLDGQPAPAAGAEVQAPAGEDAHEP